MTILELKTAIASLLSGSGTMLTVSDLTLNGLDMGLVALNQVRLQAEMLHNFNFQRKLLTLSVNTVTGGSLDAAVLYGTATTAEVKQVVEIGQFDDFANFRPTAWMTTDRSLDEQWSNNVTGIRYPTDGEATSFPNGGRRFTLTGNTLYSWPKTETAETLTVGIEAYVFSADWTASSNTVVVTGGTGVTAVNQTYFPYSVFNSHPLYIGMNPTGTPAALYFLWHNGTDKWFLNQLPGTPGSDRHFFASTSQNPTGSYTGVGTFTGTAVAALASADSTSDIWTTKGAQYLIWASVVYLNNHFKEFVPRQEGGLAPPQNAADAALQTLINWDIFKYEQFSRDTR